MMEALKQPIYYCRRIKEGEEGYTEGFELFHPPEKRWLNMRDLDGETQLVTGGEIKTRNIIAKRVWQDYEEKARCYIGKEPPEEFNPLCEDANYEVLSVDVVNRVKTVIFNRYGAAEG